jgi:hypothetical protein
MQGLSGSVTLDGLRIIGGNAHGLGYFGRADIGGGLNNVATALTVRHRTFEAASAAMALIDLVQTPLSATEARVARFRTAVRWC